MVNMIANSGFEYDFGGLNEDAGASWEGNPVESRSRVQGDALFGDWYGVLTNPDNRPAPNLQSEINDYNAVAEGQILTASAYVRWAGGTDTWKARLDIQFWDANNEEVTPAVVGLATSVGENWTRLVTAGATVPAGAANAHVRIMIRDSVTGDVLHVDGVQLEFGDTATPYAPHPSDAPAPEPQPKTVLADHQWSLEAEDGSGSFLFGTLDTGIQTSSAPDLGTREVRKRTHLLPREDGRTSGVEYEDGTTLSFECNVLTDNWEGQSDLLDEFRAAWSQRRFRNDPGAYAVLKVRNAGRTRRCYGRPDRFAEADGDLTEHGYTPVVATFDTRDGKFYTEETSTAQISVKPPEVLGFTTPLVTGLPGNPDAAFVTETLDDGQTPGNVTVKGGETWPWVEIHGPITNPRVELGDLVLELDYSIPDGMSVLLDPRPWSRRVVRSDGANLAGKLTWSTPPMGQWLMQPGSYPLTLRGSDPTASAFAIVTWREAHYRP